MNDKNRFIELKEAYEVLRRPTSRREYDMRLGVDYWRKGNTNHQTQSSSNDARSRQQHNNYRNMNDATRSAYEQQQFDRYMDSRRRAGFGSSRRVDIDDDYEDAMRERNRRSLGLIRLVNYIMIGIIIWTAIRIMLSVYVMLFRHHHNSF